jgi:hypothetical protein
MVEVEHAGAPDPEAQLREHGAALAGAIAAALAGWVDQVVRRVVAEQALVLTPATEQAISAAGAAARDEIGASVAELLNTDLHAQRSTPLAVLRGAVAYPTVVLHDLGAAPVERDEFARRAFPADVFGLTPAAFADLGPAVHDAGVAWGAAKAFVHLRRHRSDT